MGLRLDARRADSENGWRHVSTLQPGDQPGSLSDHTTHGVRRDVIIFECCGRYSTVSRSKGGADVLHAGATVREVLSLGSDLLARLLPGEQHEMTVRLDSGLSLTVRWTQEPA